MDFLTGADPISGSVFGGGGPNYDLGGGPSQAGGAAYGAPAYGGDSDINVGGLTINKKPDLIVLLGAALLGGAVFWLIKR